MILLAALGCGGQDGRKPTFPTRGKPAVNAQVIFHPRSDPDGKAPRPTAAVGADGSFSLQTYTAGDGAPAGDYAVTVSWPQGDSPIGGDADHEPVDARQPDHPGRRRGADPVTGRRHG